MRRPGARERLTANVAATIGLVAIWMLLWNSFSWAKLVFGVVLAALVLVVFPLPQVRVVGRIRPVGVARFTGRFVVDLVVASAQVAWLALRPSRRPPRSAVVGVTLHTDSELHITATAIALSLVPGSIVVDVDRATSTLYVHVLDVADEDDVEEFRRRVLALERRVLGAIGSDEDLARLDRPGQASRARSETTGAPESRGDRA